MVRKRPAVKENRPNLFIVGSMKCGTTILYDFLSAHPEVSVGTEKEVHYFSVFYNNNSEAWYTKKFENAGRSKFYLDASPSYFDMCMDVPTAERIKKFSPNAKIIIMIRNPIDRAISQFGHMQKINRLPLLQGMTFDDLVSRNWPLDENAKGRERLRGMAIGFSLYEKKIQKFVDLFGRENVLLINNDDLRKHGPVVVKQVFEFLDLTAPEGVDFTEERYVHRRGGEEISQKNYFALLEELGDDYYRCCRVANVRRPVAPDATISFNQPVGSLVAEVGVGEDGWLFLASGSNNVLEMYLEDDATQQAVCTDWHNIIARRAQRLKDMGSRYYHVMIPEKMTVLGSKLHWPIDLTRSRGIKFNATAPSSIRGNIVDLITYVKSLDGPEKLYLQTDSHWNYVGAFVAYQLINSFLGFELRNELISRPKHEGNLVFDLGSKLPDQPREKTHFANFRQDSELVSDDGLVRYKRAHKAEGEGSLHVGSYVEFKNDSAPNKETIIIFGDSFSEYRDHLLTALMAETFARTIFVWSANIDYSLCEAVKPDVVFSFMTERFMARRPDDNFDLKDYTQKKLAALELLNDSEGSF